MAYAGVLPDNLLDHLPHAPRRAVLGEEVYDSLKLLIMDHLIPPGTRLNIDALTKQLGTSSTPVREALARLEADGLATKLPMRGYSVAPVLTAGEIAELYELRLLIEPWATGRAARQSGPEGARRLQEELARAEEAPEGTGHEAYKHFSGHDARLHDLILELAGNARVRNTLLRAHAHLQLYRVAYDRQIGLPAVAEHTAIVDAVARGDASVAEAAMRTHLEAARDRLVAVAAA